MECELCGKESNELVEAIIEGSLLKVCKNCAKYGKIKKEERISTFEHMKNKKNPVKEVRETELIISPDAKEKLKEYRESLGLTREELAKKLGVKVNLIEKLERGDYNIDVKEVLKLEKRLKLKLTEEITLYYSDHAKKKEEEILTVGDVVKIIENKNEK
ncbi:MAG TPA: TIGR00270 family protein [Nautiliaceae bacterium]|nr:TIGR00270 family protein [Nautiliaceae bacterium]